MEQTLEISVAATHPHPRPATGSDALGFCREEGARSWQQAIARAAVDAMSRGQPPRGPVEVTLMFAFKTNDRTRWFAPHTLRPSADRLAKLALDALAVVGALGANDCDVAKLTVAKVWRMRNGLTVTVRPHPSDDDRTMERLVGAVIPVPYAAE